MRVDVDGPLADVSFAMCVRSAVGTTAVCPAPFGRPSLLSIPGRLRHQVVNANGIKLDIPLLVYSVHTSNSLCFSSS